MVDRLFNFPWILLLLAIHFCSSAVAITNVPPIVDLGYAQYQGSVVVDQVTNVNRTQFLGIRYAAPPTGSARFTAPKRPAATPAVQNAIAEPPGCYGGELGGSPNTPFRDIQSNLPRAIDPGQSEDCLFLNVYTPGNLHQKRNLPVVVYIHGGGYMGGSAASLDGNSLVRESGERAVAVVIQYRLGLFGFLAGQKVKDGGALNAGLLDQQFALKWVQEHIAKFGGDPRKVTIWGTSAGAGSVLQHVVANGGRTNPSLFRAAMTSSTFLPSQYRFNDAIPEILYNETVSRTGCSSSVDTLDCLRKVDLQTLQAAHGAIGSSGFSGTYVFVPVVDGTFIVDRPTVLLKEHRINGEILLSVTNTFEGNSFVDQTTASTVEPPNFVMQLFPKFTQQQAQAAADQYAGLGTNIFQANAIMGESIFICPTYFLLRAFQGIGFKGEFAIPPGSHADDVAYYFQISDAPPFANTDFDNAFSQSFLNFVLSMNPNTKWDPTNITPHWPLWIGSNEMLFNRTEAGSPDIRPIKTSDALLDRCNFWENMGIATSQ